MRATRLRGVRRIAVVLALAAAFFVVDATVYTALVRNPRIGAEMRVRWARYLDTWRR